MPPLGGREDKPGLLQFPRIVPRRRRGDDRPSLEEGGSPGGGGRKLRSELGWPVYAGLVGELRG